MVGYRERPAVVDRAMLWERAAAGTPSRIRVLPDGCLDLIWDGRRLFVAGPDSTARMHSDDGHAVYTALRFSAGLGPTLLSVPADELRDQTPDLDALWPTRPARALIERVAADPATALESWALRRYAAAGVDPLGDRLVRMADSGMPVAAIAESLGMTTRTLHRRCRVMFGYGPARLGRVLRMHRALDMARAGTELADVATHCGYADQPHMTRDVRALAGVSPRAVLAESTLR